MCRVAAVVLAAGFAAGLVAGPACNRSGGPRPVVLDGRPRFPDAEGVVEQVDFSHLTLDGGRTYKVTRRLQSFSSQTLQAVPLLGRRHQYVQVGLDGRTLRWIAAIGSVLPLKPPTVFYTGTLLRVERGRAVFRDGTVLTVERGVASPATNAFVQAAIDPATHRVRSIRLP